MKKKYLINLMSIVLIFVGFSTANAQSTNIAPSATTSAYTPDPNGIYTWGGINNGVNVSCNSGQEAFIWTSSYGKPNGTEYMQWDFSTTKTIGKFVFHNANNNARNMTGCQLQYWNGSSWVNWSKFTIAQACVDSCKFTPVSSTKFRLTGFEMNGSGQQSNPNWREIEIWTASTKKDDVGITAITPPLCSPTIVVTYTNLGTNSIDSAKINWTVNGVTQQQNRYVGTVAPGIGKSVTLSPNYSFVDGSTYNLKVWTSLPNNRNDSVPANDTAKLTFKYVGPSGDPKVSDVIKCGPGRAPLTATPIYQADSIVWYDAATGGKQIAQGKTTLSPPLKLGVNTFYAQAFKMSTPSKVGNGLNGNYILSANTSAYNGGMLDFMPSTDMVVDSLNIRLYYGTTGSTYSVYYRSGTYVGYENNSTGWNLLVTGVARVVTVGGKNVATLKIPETALLKGQTYGFYITTTPTTGNDLYATYGNTSFNDANIKVSGGAYIYGQFASIGVYSPYTLDCEVFYRTRNCPSNRVPVKVTVKPSPAGAAFIKGSPFTSPVPNTTGYANSPDIVASKDQLTYEITPPTGYSNAGHNSTWKTSNLTVRTKSGRVLSSSFYSYTNPGSSGNGILKFTPDSTLTDTTIIITMRLEDLGPYFCDSMLTRYIYVAPRPVPDFKFPVPICDGQAVLFDNLSKISSGGMTYHWDFGTGNAADTINAFTTVFTFPTYGTYNVTLKTTSIPYGYVVSKTYPIVITEIPKINFKVINACEKVSVQFQNSTTHSGTVAYAWDFGDPSTTLDKSTAKSPTWIYSNPGGYKVTLKATASGCTSELTKNANQFATPKANFNAPSLICDKSDIQFTNSSTIKYGNMGYTWNFGDGSVTNFANPVHNFSNATPKTVKMKVVSEFGCSDSITKVLTLAESPKADFSWGPACNLTNTNFTFTGSKPASPAITNFTWDFSGEGTTTVENPSKLFSVVGIKNVTLTLVSNNGCSNTITKEVPVKLQSKADFLANDVCENDDAVFINKSTVSAGNLTYTWKFGDGQKSASQSPRHRYNIGGSSKTYNVTLVAIVPGGCSDSIIKPISVNSNPDGGFSYKTSGRLVYFTANQAGATSYNWRFGDGGNSKLQNPQYSYLEFDNGDYTACLAVTNAAGCQTETCKTISITGGINNITKLSGVKVYPNPNKGNFTVTVQDPKADIAIAVYNLLGDVIKTVSTNSLKSTYEIDLNAANGVYLVKVTNGGLVSTQKITVNK
jgi:PKD repeat protein